MCSGTSFQLVELESVWGEVSHRTMNLPGEGVLEALDDAVTDRALTFFGPDGLLILTLVPRDNDLELLVLLAVSTGTPGAFRRQESAVRAIARDLGASAVVFTPARRGWTRLLGPEWITRGNAYVRRLHGG